LFGWLIPEDEESEQDSESTPDPVAEINEGTASPSNPEEEDENPNN